MRGHAVHLAPEGNPAAPGFRTPDYQSITTHLYFQDDLHNEDDNAATVKPELMLDIQSAESGEGHQTTCDFVLDPA